MDKQLIVVHVNGGTVEAIYVNGVDNFDVRVIDISDQEEQDAVYTPMPLFEMAQIGNDAELKAALDRSMVCPDPNDIHEGDGTTHGLCPNCLTRPLSCDEEGEPFAICDHCNWEDEEPE